MLARGKFGSKLAILNDLIAERSDSQEEKMQKLSG